MPRHPLSCTVRFKRLHDDVQLPQRQSEEAAGFDLRAYLPDGKVGISPGEVRIIPTGFAMQTDAGYEAQIRPTWKGPHIESLKDDHVLLRNLDNTTLIIEHGDVVGVLFIRPVVRTSIIEEQD